ncbi:MAG TPA: tetratricopeptide repeat protein [Hyphomicrobiaceae bacterium]|nr:tetratricopeptide repeat protein [Hyphomicrobiaceae bacterium]
MRTTRALVGVALFAVLAAGALGWPARAGLAAPGDKPAPQGSGEPAPATPAERAKLLESLYRSLAAAPSAEAAEPITRSIEQLWLSSGSPTADLLLERAISAAASEKTELAMRLLNVAVELQPDFAEGWNRRAYIHYLRNDYQRALGDLRRVLALEPNHYKALEGLAQILREIGERNAASEAYQRLLAVHPNAAGAKQALDELARELEGQGI